MLIAGVSSWQCSQQQAQWYSAQVPPCFSKTAAVGTHGQQHVFCRFTCCCHSRGDVQPGEDIEDFNPTYLRQRKPSLALVALFAILDPPREEAIQAAKVAHNAGITVKMITGMLCAGDQG
jgi:hypothetical protein